MDRRRFLQFGAFSALAAGFGSLVRDAAAADYRAAVCVFLSGGCDANNLIVPTDDAGYGAYATARPALAIPRDQLLPVNPSSGGHYGLHPQLPELQQLFTQGRLAVVANVGTLIMPTTPAQANSGTWPLPENLMSHLDQQNQWVMLEPGAPATVTGWGGRTADLLRTFNASARFPATVSVAGSNVFCDGVSTAAGVMDPYGSSGIQGTGSDWSMDQARAAALAQLAGASGGPQLEGAYTGALGAALAQDQLLQSVYATGITTPFPDSYLGQQLYRVAQMIASRGATGASRQLFYVETGSFDTHADQAQTLQDLFTEISQALGAFNAAMVELGVDRNVVAFTHSEFSRTLRAAGDNGNGTDHAWGGHSLVMGGPVRGGDMYGTFPQLVLGGPDDMTDEGRWVPTTSVDQYAATIASWLGVADADLPAVFPTLANFTQKKLAFL
jgi:uncharacterized protein (DUF1501 family)